MTHVRRLVRILLVLSCASCASMPQSSGSPVAGAWLVVDVRFGDEGGENGAMRAQPGQFLFTDRRYAAVWVTQIEPRALAANPWAATREEMIANYQSLAANSGTYDISGSQLTIRPIVAKNPNFPGGQLTYEFRIEGDMLFLESIDERTAAGIVPPDFDSIRERLVLRRVD